MTLQFKRKYSTQGSGAPCHVSFGFSPDFSGYSCQNFRWTVSHSIRLSLRLGGYSIWSAILQSHFHISLGFKTTRAFLKTFESSTRGRLGLLEETSGFLKHQLEHIPALGCFDYSWGLLTCSTRGRLRTTR
jgi:hypothetical protein